MPPMVTPSISTVKRLCWLKSPAVFLVVPLRTSRLNFTAIQRPLSVPPAGAVHCDPAAVVPLRASTPHTFRALPDRRPPQHSSRTLERDTISWCPPLRPPPLLRLP